MQENDYGNEGGIAVEDRVEKIDFVKDTRNINERKSPLDPNFKGPVETEPVPEQKPEQFVVQTQFDLLVTPQSGESLADVVARALAVYKYEKGFVVAGMTHKAYIPTKD